MTNEYKIDWLVHIIMEMEIKNTMRYNQVPISIIITEKDKILKILVTV